MPDRIEVHGAGKRGTDFIEVPTRDESMIAALEYERAGYQRRLDAGETTYGGESIAAIMQRNAGSLVFYGGRVDHASFIGATVPVPDDEDDAIPAVVGDVPPHEGWVRDRQTREWRAPKPKGRRPA